MTEAQEEEARSLIEQVTPGWYEEGWQNPDEPEEVSWLTLLLVSGELFVLWMQEKCDTLRYLWRRR